DLVGKTLIIAEGKGAGQSAVVLSTDMQTGTLVLEQPLRVVPDQSSLCKVGDCMNRMAYFNNDLNGYSRLTTAAADTATAALNAYGSSVNLVFVSNKVANIESGVVLYSYGADGGINAGPNGMAATCFTQVEGNTIRSVKYGIGISPDPNEDFLEGTTMFGHVIRGNTFSDIKERVVGYSTRGGKYRTDMIVFDRNQASNFARSIDNDNNLKNQVWIHNTFIGNGSGSGLTLSSGDVPALRKNTWQAFSSKYAGTLPGAVLELPTRVKQLGTNTTSGSVEVLNSGTAALNWSAVSDSAWLRVTQASGTVSDENNVGTMAFEIATPPQNGAEAVVTVTAGSETKQMTVVYDTAAITPPPPDPPPAPVLTGISISGATSVNEGSTAQYVCTASYSDGTTAPVAATWSENSAYATISGSGVLSTGDVVADQNLVVTATYGSQTTTFAVVVKYVAPVLSGVTITGPTSVNEETTAQYTCTANYSDGTSAVITPTWSENSTYTTISASGLLSAGNVAADQNVTITASFGGKSDTHAVSIKYVAPTLSSVTITGPTSVNEETTAQYTCTANYSDGTSAVVAPTWSENSTYTTISASGLLSAGNVAADQNVTITANFGGKSDTHAVVVKYVAPVLSGVTITGPTSVNEETTAQYTCTANYSDGTSAVVVPTWSENSTYTTISASGLLTAGNVAADQNVTITASFGGKSDTHAVTVKYVVPTLIGIAITGPVVVDEESSAQYSCTATYSDGTSAVVVPAWTQNSGYASIDAAGLLVTGNVTVDQNFTITASFGGLVDMYAVRLAYVAPPVVLTGIVIEGPAILEENTTTQFVCTATYSDGTSAVVVPTWSENSTYTTINAAGLLSAGNVAADQSVTITATFGGKVATQSLTLLMVGTQITYPLSGFAGQRILAELWDDVAQAWRTLGEAVGPDELVIEDMNAGQWYWLRIKQYDDASGLWVKVHGNWISM
ncbi:MAG: hypothetical protein K9L89_03355, partial [Kiritimatiellales bacterium]|nr:hypothetical protein [Kiritimatiellales bacterium]